QLFIRLFGSGTDQSTKATREVHINNLQQIISENNMLLQKSVITIISDNGPDWSTDCHSRFNPTERMFSRLTDLLQGAIIDLDASFKETSLQLDMVLIELCKYWNNKSYCNYKIDCGPMFSVNGNVFHGHEKLKNLLVNKSRIQIQENSNV
ncbi:unnamed protein product, partial [Rotaria sp. Silwood1]